MSAEAADDEVPQPRPSKKRKKKQQEAAAESITTPTRAEEGEAEDRDGAKADAAPASARPEVPSFARGFPRDDELDRLVAAFERGDHAAVREGAARLAKGSPDDDVRRAAAELLRRIDPDPLAVGLLLAAVALLVFLSAWYWAHAHASP